MKLAIRGSGITGLAAGLRLDPIHDVPVLEAEPRMGRHANTAAAHFEGRSHPADSGFIVSGRPADPRFSGLLPRCSTASTAAGGGHATGARWRHGFPVDGAWSAMRVARPLGAEMRAMGSSERFLRLRHLCLCYRGGRFRERAIGASQMIVERPGCPWDGAAGVRDG